MNEFLQNALRFITVVLLAALIGGVYGALHDQFTYSVSPEYYTKFKFYQFGLVDLHSEPKFDYPRIQVAVVGFLATWWVGFAIGAVFGVTSIFRNASSTMISDSIKAMLITMAIAFLVGLIGLALGWFYLKDTGVDWWLPENLEDVDAFITVGSMHNFSYAGGVLGFLVAIAYGARKE